MGPNGSDSPELASFFASASICITPVAKRLASQALLIRGGNIFGQLRYRWPGISDPLSMLTFAVMSVTASRRITIPFPLVDSQ